MSNLKGTDKCTSIGDNHNEEDDGCPDVNPEAEREVVEV